MNVAHNLEASTYFFPDRIAVRQDDRSLTYKELNEQANRIATGLMGLGVQPGDHIGLCAPNSIDWIAFYFGVFKAGAVAVTFSALLTGDELELLADHSKPRVMFTTRPRLQDLKPLKDKGVLKQVICEGGDMDLAGLAQTGSPEFKAMDRDRRDTAAILYTGGTTGIPKGVMLTHESIVFSSHSIACYERSTQDDVGICFMPFNHVFGQIHIMNSMIMSAGCLELLPSFDLDKIVALLEAGRITKFFAVPTVYIRLLSMPDLKQKLGRLRYCFSAGAAMAMEVVRQWKERTGITISESYGQTEAMPITYNHYYPERHVVGSVGHAVPMVEVQIRDMNGHILGVKEEGEICVRGPIVMKGYLNNPEATREAFWDNEWLRTGDIGIRDADGYIYIVDRVKDMIITGGENVYPREVEEALYTSAVVEECAVIGLPDKEWGERVVAFVVPGPGQNVVAEELKLYLRTKLSPFKVPKEYIVLADLPKSPAGKVLKRELRRQYSVK